MRHATLQLLGLKNQQLLSQCLNLGFITEAQHLQQVDRALIALLLEHKMYGGSTHYIWRTQEDDKVRLSHAANDGRLFAWDTRPDTGHPGEDYNCRCWAEPINAQEYANQMLIGEVNDNPRRWTNGDLNDYYNSGNGGVLTLSQIGYLGYVIDHFANSVETSDGSTGGYQAVEKQIIAEARRVRNGPVPYGFSSSYPFGNTIDIVTDTINNTGYYSFGESTVEGVFTGEVREEKGFLVISGIMDYEFSDKFKDRFQVVETLDTFFFLDREEAEDLADEWFGVGQSDKKSFEIKGNWRTKFNATVDRYNHTTD